MIHTENQQFASPEEALKHFGIKGIEKGDWDTPAPAPWIQSFATDDTEAISEKGEEFTQKILDK